MTFTMACQTGRGLVVMAVAVALIMGASALCLAQSAAPDRDEIVRELESLVDLILASMKKPVFCPDFEHTYCTNPGGTYRLGMFAA